MIASLTGTLTFVDDDRIHLQVGAILYELLVPAADVTRLKDDIGLEMTFHTLLYLQGDANGGNLEPRLIGFLRREDKKFFEKFITVKGIGPNKALKALALPVGEIAHAIGHGGASDQVHDVRGVIVIRDRERHGVLLEFLNSRLKPVSDRVTDPNIEQIGAGQLIEYSPSPGFRD